MRSKVYKMVDSSQKFQVFLIALLYMLFLSFSYRYGVSDQTCYLPRINNIKDAGYIENDWYVNTAYGHHTVLFMLAKISQFIPLGKLFYLTWAIAVITTLTSIGLTGLKGSVENLC